MSDAATSPDAAPDMDLLGDTKTGGDICDATSNQCVKQRPSEFKRCLGYPHSIKGVYAEAGLQMSAYREAKTAWLKDGTKVPMPPTHPAGFVLHLRPEKYLVVPVHCGPSVYRHFEHARHVADWTCETSKTVVGAPLMAPTSVTQKEGAA